MQFQNEFELCRLLGANPAGPAQCCKRRLGSTCLSVVSLTILTSLCVRFGAYSPVEQG